MALHRTPASGFRPGSITGRFGAGRAIWTMGASVAALALFAGVAATRGPLVSPPPRSAAVMWSDLLAEGTHQPAAASAAKAQDEQRILTEFLSKRYRVAQEATGNFVAAAFVAGREYEIDPLLVLAVTAVESRFNPVAESALGAKGLMQVLPKYHQDKLTEHGGEAALLDPSINIQIGTRILREYLRRGGSVEAGLQLYGGASDEPSAQYAGKVLGERARMAQLLARHRRPAA